MRPVLSLTIALAVLALVPTMRSLVAALMMESRPTSSGDVARQVVLAALAQMR